MPYIGNKLKELRESKGLNQEELSSRSGISINTIRKLEQNQRAPRPSLEDKICKFFGITRIQLYFNVEKPTVSKTDELIRRKQLISDMNQWAAQADLKKIESVIELLKR